MWKQAITEFNSKGAMNATQFSQLRDGPSCELAVGRQILINNLAMTILLCRYKEDIFMRAMEVLKQVCELPVGIAVLQREPQIFRRLQLVAQSLDRKIQVEKRYDSC